MWERNACNETHGLSITIRRRPTLLRRAGAPNLAEARRFAHFHMEPPRFLFPQRMHASREPISANKRNTRQNIRSFGSNRKRSYQTRTNRAHGRNHGAMTKKHLHQTVPLADIANTFTTWMELQETIHWLVPDPDISICAFATVFGNTSRCQ